MGVIITAMAKCFHCKKAIDARYRPGRGEACPACGSDLLVCLNCRFYDPASYNECREPAAERVLDKEKANFCEYFEFGEAKGSGKAVDPVEELKKLFKT